MRILRLATVALFAVTLLIFSVFFVSEKIGTDRSHPVIEAAEGVLEVDVDVTDEELLEGVTAFDKKDGDITSDIVVESVSRFIEGTECIVTYAVSDSDNHVAKCTRNIRYKNYTPPKFAMSAPLVYSLGDTVNILGSVGARDVIDGNISDKVVISATDYNDNAEGVYSLSLQVMNSKGDASYLDLPIYVENISLLAPKIELSEYLIYLKKGQKADFNSYVSRISFQNGAVEDAALRISTDCNFDVPGTYSVHYYATRAEGHQGHTVLTVIVEE
ncbi:MAG: hypothetical protein IJD49_07050 [Clostridia bacterium]|nr:hypothetical protein [Clostridia bacterium]